MYYGDITLEDTIDIKFTTRRFSTGAPFTLAGTPTVAAYPGNSTTEITAGITLTVDFDARTGLNNVRVVATAANGYATATNYALVITAGTVDSVSVVGEVVGSFSIGNRPTNLTRVNGTVQTTDLNTIDDFVDTEVAAIKAKTDQLTFTVANRVDATTESGGVVLTAAERNSIADALLNRDMATGTDSGSTTVRTVRQALRFLRNKWSISGSTLTVTKEDDATTSHTAALGTTAGADPVTSVDPAGP